MSMAGVTVGTFFSISPPNFRRTVTFTTAKLKPPRFPSPLPAQCAFSEHVVVRSTSLSGSFEKNHGEERRRVMSSAGKFKRVRFPAQAWRLSAHTEQAAAASTSVFGSFEKKRHGEEAAEAMVLKRESAASLKDYFELSKVLIKPDGGPPRWFSPLECGPRLQDSPLLLFLPGVDGVGLGLILHHQRLGGLFNLWCLHIPVMDRTSFTDLVKLIERTIISENNYAPNRPIYLIGESLGACLALAVAARNPHIDLVLVLANPATSFEKSMLECLKPIFWVMPDDLYVSLPYTLSVIEGDPLRMAISSFRKGHSLQQNFGDLSQSLIVLSSYFSVMVDILPRETLLWKLKLLKSASSFVNSRLHAIKAQTLILASAKDRFLPSQEEGETLCRAMQNCVMRKFDDSGHFLFLEGGMNLVTVLKGASFYRRGRYHDYVSDYVPLSPSEFEHMYEPHRWVEIATSPVMLSTLGNGNIVRGLSGIPSEGPVLLVGYHMLLGLELISMVSQFYFEKNINVRGIAHPMLFTKLKDGSFPDISTFDITRVLGAVPVSAKNLFKLFSSKSHALLYPGGMREALHRKGEQYKLFWPEQSEFIRMAARFGATIIPFGAVGEDDIGEMLFDYNDQMKIPYLKSLIQELTEETIKLRLDAVGEVSNQDVHCPWILPKVPGRFYFLFGKPIETEGMKQELKDRDKSHELYLQVKSEVESSIAYLKENREKDPYRNILPRLVYQAQHGFSSEVPTFKL